MTRKRFKKIYRLIRMDFNRKRSTLWNQSISESEDFYTVQDCWVAYRDGDNYTPVNQDYALHRAGWRFR